MTAAIFLTSLASQAAELQGEVRTWADTMRDAGGWGVSVVLAAVVAWQQRTMRADAVSNKAELAAERAKTEAWTERVIKAVEKGGA